LNQKSHSMKPSSESLKTSTKPRTIGLSQTKSKENNDETTTNT